MGVRSDLGASQVNALGFVRSNRSFYALKYTFLHRYNIDIVRLKDVSMVNM